MKFFLCLTTCFLTSVVCFSQKFADSIFFNRQFKWTIIIPEGFESVHPDSIKVMHARGAKKMEKSLNQLIEDNTTNICMFKANRFNYFESCFQPFDTLVDGKIETNNKLVADALYSSFMSQNQNTSIDSSFNTEEISGLEFHKFRMNIQFPNNIIFKVLMYSRVFGKKLLAVNIYYLDDIKGYLMINAFKKSKFEK